MTPSVPRPPNPPLRELMAAQALRYMDQVAAWPVFAPNYAAMCDAVELSSSARPSAARSGAKRLHSEDLQHGQRMLGVEILNPFRGRA